MKVLYIGYYKENSDWGISATNNILALESAGVDVVCRPIIFSSNKTPEAIKHLENKSTDGCNVCIQHVFPEHMTPSEVFSKNIALLMNDFIEINHSCWVEKLTRMSEIWVPSKAAVESFQNTAIAYKVKQVPLAIDTNYYMKQINQSLQTGVESEGKFKFYTISDVNNVNLDRLLRCFHSEFDHTHNAVLAIQINSENTQLLDERIARVKSSLGLNKDVSSYKKDIIVPKTNDMIDSSVMHNFGDCYISCLSQRVLNFEEVHAMGFGKTPIVSYGTDSVTYFSTRYAIPSIYTVNTDKSGMHSDVNNGKNYKIIPCEKQLKKMMRDLYFEWKNNPVTYKLKKQKEAIEILNDFSIDNVGKIMKGIINA